MQEEFGWTAPEAYAINTWIAVGTAIVCFGIGPVIDRLGRRRGMMTTIGGTAIVSGLTSLIPRGARFISNALLVFVRSFGGLGFSEQAVNATYMNEVYQVTEDEKAQAPRLPLLLHPGRLAAGLPACQRPGPRSSCPPSAGAPCT